jgi:tetratricopeptide (TPR) repeat protein
MISIPFAEKIKYFVKEGELCIKAGNFQRADEAMKKAMAEANAIEKNDIYFTMKNFYKQQAETYERNLKRANAARVYEKLLEMKITDAERKEIKEKLLVIYDKLGKVKEYLILKKGL